MPTITPADAILTATRDLQDSLEGDIPQSQYDKGMVEKFIEVLNAKAKTYQIEKILEQHARTETTQAQRVVADTNEIEDECLDEDIHEEAQPEVDTPSANTRSIACRVGPAYRNPRSPFHRHGHFWCRLRNVS